MARSTGSIEAKDAAYEHLNWLRSVAIRGGWAYPFDVQTRTFHYPQTTPNVVCTAFAGNAFLDAAELFSDEAALATATDAARFVVRELLHEDAGGPYFKYLPSEKALIHNGNVLAAHLIVRCGTLTNDPHLVDIGRQIDFRCRGPKRFEIAKRMTIEAPRAVRMIQYVRKKRRRMRKIGMPDAGTVHARDQLSR